MGIGEKIRTGIDTLSRKANQALDEGRLRMELLRVRRRRDAAARELGYVAYRQSKGTPPAEGEADALTQRMADADQAMAKLEDELRTLQQQGGAAGQP